MATTHPLADALCTVAQEMHAIAPSVSAGQACWSFDTIPFVGASFIKRAGASAHQSLPTFGAKSASKPCCRPSHSPCRTSLRSQAHASIGGSPSKPNATPKGTM